jgi:hypothetical protein
MVAMKSSYHYGTLYGTSLVTPSSTQSPQRFSTLQTGNQMREVEATISDHARFEVVECLRLLELELRNALASPAEDVRQGAAALLARVVSDQKAE